MRKIQEICLVLLIASLSFGFTSCQHTRGYTLCVSDPAQGGFQCSKDGGEIKTILFKDTENYIALPAADAEKLLNECYDPRRGD